MKKYTVLTVCILILFLAAGAVSAYFTYTVLHLPSSPEGIGEQLGAGLTVAFSLLFISFAAAIELIASFLSLLGLILAKKEKAGRTRLLFFTLFLPLPILVSALSYLLVLA